MVLLVVITFMFGITITQGVKEALKGPELSGITPATADLLQRVHGGLFRSMITLSQSVLGGFSWAEVSGALQEVHWSYELLFCLFVTFTSLALLNVVTGVFVDSAMRSAATDRNVVIQDQMAQESSYARELKKLFMEADEHQTGLLSQEEFLDYLRDQHVQSYLRALGIHASEAAGLFNLLDMDDSGTVDVDEFMMGCLRIKGEAKSVDIATLMYENKKIVNTIVGAMETLTTQVDEMRRLALQRRRNSVKESKDNVLLPNLHERDGTV
eukprot:CAMPEP_0204521954 /NCGR_PEP_ID=MMETSP0661-20131031/6060_1 /ASSEMBLY_ACC=CAM_ASM_000606 /TAXON_ID=109239 /ORGANISM="Alexandrium margalefi, Strain AMGDE01CS-322" /LENGTH=268 /DNA_ID=CAMNT_0051527583 /DNA_START=47 /DNA_END=853 /DNA_ORIENTATION=+